jgi:hypothetical protein
MRKYVLVGGLLLVFALALVVGSGTAAAASPVGQAAVVSTDATVSADADLLGGRGVKPLPLPMPNLRDRIHAAVLQACPCRGPLDADGKPVVDADGNRVPWTDHAEWMACASARVDELTVGRSLTDEQIEKIKARLDALPIGNADYVCPIPAPLRAEIRQRLTTAVMTACPCQGPLDADGKPLIDVDGNRIPWVDHAEWMACASARVDEIAAAKGLTAEQVDKIKAGLDKLPIGNPDYVCPALRPPLGPRPGPGARP